MYHENDEYILKGAAPLSKGVRFLWSWIHEVHGRGWCTRETERENKSTWLDVVSREY